MANIENCNTPTIPNNLIGWVHGKTGNAVRCARALDRPIYHEQYKKTEEEIAAALRIIKENRQEIEEALQ